MAYRYRFRFWDKENNKWFYFGFETYPTYEKYIWEVLTNGETMYQSTNRKDKKNIFIFEGDIVYDEYFDEYFVVEWDDDSLGFMFTADGESYGIEQFTEPLEIVGNIYENRELLIESEDE